MVKQMHDDSDQVMAALKQLTADGDATDRQRAAAQHAYAELATLRAENEQLRRERNAFMAFCNADQTRLIVKIAALEAERDAIRNETLEEAAKVAESLPGQRGNSPEHLVGRSIASAIRNLKEPSDD
jgi:septal ring factor EnvC (AmiA/AmiB activator)